MIKKILIISYGSIAQKHIKNIRQISKTIKIGILRSKNKTSINSKYLIFNKISQAIEFKPDAIFICSPANTHIYYLKKFDGICKNIFIEKPLCSNINQIRSIKVKKKINLQLGYFLRYHPHLHKIKKIIKSKIYGKIKFAQIEVGQYLPDWRPNIDYIKTVSSQKKLGGGVMRELSHEIDYAIWLFGIPEYLFCKNKKLSKLKINVEDFSLIYFDYPKEKKIVQINLNMFQRNSSRSCIIHFEKKTLKIDFIKGCLYELNKGNSKIIHSLGTNHLKKIIFAQDYHFLKKSRLVSQINKKYIVRSFANFVTGKILTKILDRLIKSNKIMKIVKF